MRMISLGIIGCGKIAENHIKAAQNLGLKISFLVDISQERMLEFVKKFNLANVLMFLDFQKIISEQIKVDFVTIATSSSSHFLIASKLIYHGYNVLIEKPISLSLKDISKLNQLAEQHRVTVGAIHPNRFIQSINFLYEAIRNHEFGKISHASLHVRLNRGEEYFKQAQWRGTWKHDGGGVLMNQSLHDLDLLQWIIPNEIKSIKGSIRNISHPYIQAEDLGLAIIEFQNGSLGLVEATSNVYAKNLEESLYIFGEKGTVKLTGKSLNQIEIWDTHLHPKVIAPMEVFGIQPHDLTNLHIPVFNDFIYAIEKKQPPKISISEAAKSLALILGIYQSALTDKTLYYPIQDLKAEDFQGKFKW
jgi:UDP-N-acetyl-2-amino-2-deoxyglucuronate dehydrogenase